MRLYSRGDNIFFEYNEEYYWVTSQPYGPCVCLVNDAGVFRTIRSAFETSEIFALLSGGAPLVSGSGHNVDADKLANIFAAALDDSRSELDFDDLESLVDGQAPRYLIHAIRSSVCMGDDCTAPNAAELQYEKETTLSEFMPVVAAYLPQMSSCVWEVRCADETIARLAFDENADYAAELSIPDCKVHALKNKAIFCRYICQP